MDNTKFAILTFAVLAGFIYWRYTDTKSGQEPISQPTVTERAYIKEDDFERNLRIVQEKSKQVENANTTKTQKTKAQESTPHTAKNRYAVPQPMLVSYAHQYFGQNTTLRSLESFYQGNMSILCGEMMLSQGWRSFALIHTANTTNGERSIQTHVDNQSNPTYFHQNIRSVYCRN